MCFLLPFLGAFVSLDVPVPDACCTSSSIGSPAHVGCAWCFIACALHLFGFIQCVCQWGSDILASTLLALLLTAGFPFFSRKRFRRIAVGSLHVHVLRGDHLGEDRNKRAFTST